MEGAVSKFGYDELLDRRRGKPSPKRIPFETVHMALGLYQEDAAVGGAHKATQRRPRCTRSSGHSSGLPHIPFETRPIKSQDEAVKE
ncbi:MAG: hypothetical protein ABI882_08855 [Acidobacteriota bacterium]